MRPCPAGADRSERAGATAVVPLRDGAGKTRLASVLPGEGRRTVVESLAGHVLSTLLEVDRIERVLVVTADRGFAEQVLATRVPRTHAGRVVVVDQPSGAVGLDAAVDAGRELVWPARDAVPDDVVPDGGRLLVIHADLPELTPADVTALLDDSAPVVLATDRSGTGTNAVALAPRAHRFAFAFGAGSLQRHLDRARDQGLVAVVVRRDGTSADLDTPADWDALPPAVRARLLG